MILNPNQFALTTVQGQRDLGVQGNTISCRVNASESTALVAGQAVKLSDVAGGVPVVTALSANTDFTFGFVLRNPKDQNFAANDRVEIAINDTVVYMTAGAAIARGAYVEVSNAAKKVITSAGVNPIVGFALDKAAADGDLIRVYIQTPSSADLTAINNVISSVNNYDAGAGAGALPIDKDVIALTTGGAEALTLADGVEGQSLEIIMVSDGGDGTLTPANFANGTTITFDDVGDSIKLRFLGGSWYSVGTATATIA